MTPEELKKFLEEWASKAKKYTGKVPRSRRSSLHTLIKTKEQAEQLMKALKSA